MIPNLNKEHQKYYIKHFLSKIQIKKPIFISKEPYNALHRNYKKSEEKIYFSIAAIKFKVNFHRLNWLLIPRSSN